jgi:hypothetical protein
MDGARSSSDRNPVDVVNSETWMMPGPTTDLDPGLPLDEPASFTR